MATGTVTIDANEWKYPDKNGVTHTVTTAQTFTFTLTDDSTTGAFWELNGGNQGVTTTDGRKIYLRKEDTGTGGLHVLYPTDALQAGSHTVRGEWAIVCPETGVVQYWKPVNVAISDADGTGTITGTWEDQYGNSFYWNAVDYAVV